METAASTNSELTRRGFASNIGVPDRVELLRDVWAAGDRTVNTLSHLCASMDVCQSQAFVGRLLAAEAVLG
jgi:hypothetical protein